MKKPKKFVFVLMPFAETFGDIYAYGIKQSCSELNVYCERVDEQIYKERILDRIYNQIAKADLIIADMTGRNANVFYEVGYAHGIGKNVILLTQNEEDIPFDLKHYQHIIYGGNIKNLSTLLKPKIDWYLNNEDQEEVINYDYNLEFLINGMKIEEGSEIKIFKENISTWDKFYKVKIDVFNASPKVYRSKFKIGIETSFNYPNMIEGLEVIKPDTNKVLFVSKELSNIYPGSYKSVDFVINEMDSKEEDFFIVNCVLKVFTNQGLKEINFTFNIPSARNSWF